MQVLLRPAARLDLLDARDWYERQREKLGSRFITAVDVALAAIAASPASFPVVHRDVRRALVRPFPYGVFYRVVGETVHVLAVMHGHRDPSTWQARADSE